MKPDKWRHRWALAALCAMALLFLPHRAAALPHAPTQGLFLSIASAGPVAIAVGEHGHILRSTDNGAHWARADSPSQAALTRVIITPSGTVFAVGFDATILRSDDSGQHWTSLQHDDRADNPLFGIATASGGAALVVGGFGRAYASADGITWHQSHIDSAEDDPHFNTLLTLGGARWLLVGEQALALLTEDAGAHWRKLAVPVQGSLFGGIVLNPQRILLFGLRGHVIATEDGGAHWALLETGTTAELLGGTALREGGALIVGSRGTALRIDADLRTAHLLPQKLRTSLADCAQFANGAIVAVGEDGIVPIDLAPVAAAR